MTRLSISLSSIALVLAACGGSDTPAKQTTTTAKMTGDDGHGLCVQAFQRQRECTAEYIPALVAARVQADQPPGIAAKDAEMGRDALVARANEEWAEDSTDAAIDGTCTQILATIPPEKKDAMFAQGQACMDKDGCQAFVDCIIPLVSQHWGDKPPQ